LYVLVVDEDARIPKCLHLPIEKLSQGTIHAAVFPSVLKSNGSLGSSIASSLAKLNAGIECTQWQSQEFLTGNIAASADVQLWRSEALLSVLESEAILGESHDSGTDAAGGAVMQIFQFEPWNRLPLKGLRNGLNITVAPQFIEIEHHLQVSEGQVASPTRKSCSRFGHTRESQQPILMTSSFLQLIDPRVRSRAECWLKLWHAESLIKQIISSIKGCWLILLAVRDPLMACILGSALLSCFAAQSLLFDFIFLRRRSDLRSGLFACILTYPLGKALGIFRDSVMSCFYVVDRFWTLKGPERIDRFQEKERGMVLQVKESV
jgi:hypothetical protein